MSRCSSAATDSGGASSGGGWPRRSRHRVNVRSTRAIGEQAEVANAHEAARHHVQEKASQEFVGLERHDLHAVVVGVVLPAKPDAAVAVIDEPIIRQRDAVGVATEVVEHLLGAGEGPLRIHDPVDGPQLDRGTPVKAWRSARSAVPPAKVSWPVVEGALQAGEILRAKDRRRAPGPETGTTTRPAIHRERSAAKAPPVTRQWRWRCCERVWPHVCRIAVMPIVPPRCRGSRPKVSSVSAAARKSSV